MDPQLREAIEQDDTESFENLWHITRQDPKFFLTQTKTENSNILHILCHKKNPNYMTLVIRTLPIGALQTLICQTDSEGNTPLHYAAPTYIIVKLLVDGYYRARAYDYTGGIPPWRVKNNQGELRIPPWRVKNNQGELPIPPWRVKNKRGELPIQVARDRELALSNVYEEVTSYLILLDHDTGLIVDRDDDDFKLSDDDADADAEYSMENFDLLVEEYSMPRLIVSILISKTEESDALRFLQRHQRLFNCLDHSGKIVILCCAIKCNFVSIVEFILDNSEYISLNGYIPFVVATQSSNLEVAQLLVRHFNFTREVQREREWEWAREREARSLFPGTLFEKFKMLYQTWSFHPPWMPPTDMQSAGITPLHPLHYPASMYINEGKLWETPLHYAIYNNRLEFAESILSWDLSFLAYPAQDEHQRPTPIVVYVEQKGFDLPPKRVDVEGGGYTIHGSDRQSSSDLRVCLIDLHLKTFLKFLRENPVVSDINLATKLIERHPQLIKLKDTSGRAILQYALDENDINTMSLILLATCIRREEQQEEHILTRACRNSNLAAIRAICTICPDSPKAAILAFCSPDSPKRSAEDVTTVLRWVRSSNPEEYQSLLDRIPGIATIMNETERSPLMTARSNRGETAVKWISRVKEE